jgi:hypothetical protein
VIGSQKIMSAVGCWTKFPGVFFESFNYAHRSVLHVPKSQTHLYSTRSISSRRDQEAPQLGFAQAEHLLLGHYIAIPSDALLVDPTNAIRSTRYEMNEVDAHRWSRGLGSPTCIPWNRVLDPASSLHETPKVFPKKSCSLVRTTVIEIKTLQLESNTNAAVDALIRMCHIFVCWDAGIWVCTSIHPRGTNLFARYLILDAVH